MWMAGVRLDSVIGDLTFEYLYMLDHEPRERCPEAQGGRRVMVERLEEPLVVVLEWMLAWWHLLSVSGV